MGSNLSEQELKNFLQANQPLPPAADAQEMEAIFARIQKETEQPERRSIFAFLGITTAAAAALVFAFTGIWQHSTVSPSLSQDAAVSAEADWAYLAEETPDQEVGAGYLLLAGVAD